MPCKYTQERLKQLRDEILPACSSVTEAYAKAQRKWRVPVDGCQIRTLFSRRFGHPPSKYLKQSAGLTAKSKTPPADSPTLLRREIKRLEKELAHDVPWHVRLAPLQAERFVSGDVAGPAEPHHIEHRIVVIVMRVWFALLCADLAPTGTHQATGLDCVCYGR